MSTNSDKDKDMMIVKEPREDDVLLGQGHYRHQGNQKLNKIVDAKVDEYKNQSRVFKTYMAHDIINRMRSKGVRFLKELAPKGWVVVKDDKEAREKVAQRFQYMMRKQAADAKKEAKVGTTATKKTAPIAASAAKPTKADTTAPLPRLNWNGLNIKVPFLPVFHQLQKSSVLVDDDVIAIAERLQECFGIIGIQDCFNNEEANAILTTADNVKLRLNLWKPLGGNRGVIVELLHIEGDAQKVAKLSRYILEAATGLFDKYKHTLVQPGGITSGNVRSAEANIKPGMVKRLSRRALKEAESQKSPEEADSRTNKPRRRPKAKSGKSALNIPRRASLPSNLALSSAMANQSGNEPMRNGSFASGFGRWESGMETAGNGTLPRANGERRNSAPTRKPFTNGFNHQGNAFELQSRGNLGGMVGNQGLGDFNVLNGGWMPQDVRPSMAVSSNAHLGGQLGNPMPALAPSSSVLYPNNSELLFDQQDTDASERPTQRRTLRSHFDRWAPNQEMKCDSSIDDTSKVDAEMASIDHTIESIKRLSISSNDASFADSKVGRDLRVTRDAFGGLLPRTLSHHEMKCDSSFDDDDEPSGKMTNQSFIPSSIFGGAAPFARGRPDPPSPAHSFNSHISVEMRSTSPAPSANSHITMGVFSVPSPCGSFNSRGSFGMGSLRGRMDADLTPSIFDSDQSTGNEPRGSQRGVLGVSPRNKRVPTSQNLDPLGLVPPTIFVESSSALRGQNA